MNIYRTDRVVGIVQEREACTVGAEQVAHGTGTLPAYILAILFEARVPLSTREVAARLRRRSPAVPDHEVGRHLRSLLRQGKLELRGALWRPISSDGSADSTQRESGPAPGLSPPPLSDQTIALLAERGEWATSPRGKAYPNRSQPSSEEEKPELYQGPWATFRRLVAYYRQCVRNEEGADASAYQNQLGQRFFYLRRLGPWQPRSGVPWRASVPLGPHLSPFLNSLPSSPSDEEALVVGYPIQAYYVERENEPASAIIRPVFFFPVVCTLGNGNFAFVNEDPRLEVNLGWLEYSFRGKPEGQRAFLSACGFINRWRPDDEAPGLEKGESAPSLENLAAALTAFMPGRVQEPLATESVPDSVLREPFKTGIYNRAVVMLARRTKYTAGLLRELSALERAADEELDRTALRYVFLNHESNSSGERGEVAHEATVAETTLVNAEQREAVASLLERNVTVVTGPPGTGKSQVVACAVANARINGQTLLFASRNHKAIDAVYGRVVDTDGRSLMVRTNSKNDPGLNYNFSSAIREMLAEQPNPSATERLEIGKEELAALLEERGRRALAARSITESAETLGRLEERLAYLSRDLPRSTAVFLDARPDAFPRDALRRTMPLLKRLERHLQASSLRVRTSQWLHALAMLPWYLRVKRAISHIPDLPALPPFPTRRGSRNLLVALPLLIRASEYSHIRLQCHPLESNIRDLPPLEEITSAVADLSVRIAEVAPRVISLDLQSRRGVPREENREQLAGLKAAINALDTELVDGHVREQTARVLRERIPHILGSFPCWAVTNLSVGSRIPLSAGIFDLAIIDEASQSDIPSAIPILFRAKRAGVIGDPFQLVHCSRLSTAKDAILRRKTALRSVDDQRFAYTESSLYDLFASSNAVEPVFLGETYRSAEEIAGYSNAVFYGGRLRVSTDMSRLVVPRYMTPGIHWTEIAGLVQSGGGSGCHCEAEAQEVLRLVRIMLLDNHFRGSLGIVTPFRQQANRLRDLLFESDRLLYEALVEAQCHVDTAHGFQGDERDVILFSLCGGPEMPLGSLSFLRETGNLFNVAVSRARAVLHVVGNREWARRCGIRHVEQLAASRERPEGPTPRGPWHPHESPWEKLLYDALVAAGLDPLPQFPVLGKRLDMALIRKGDTGLKIDIEVDGDCHRNPDGTRKIDDVWRDIYLQGLGWKVMRFWTYQLRAGMDACVTRILEAWRQHEQ